MIFPNLQNKPLIISRDIIILNKSPIFILNIYAVLFVCNWFQNCIYIFYKSPKFKSWNATNCGYLFQYYLCDKIMKRIL